MVNMDIERNSIDPLVFGLFDSYGFNYDDYSTKFDLLVDTLKSEDLKFDN